MVEARPARVPGGDVVSVLGAGFFGPTEGEKKRRLQGGKAHAWKPMCGDRVLAGQWSGVVAAQHGPFSWVVIDGINVPQTHATITLRPVENSDGE